MEGVEMCGFATIIPFDLELAQTGITPDNLEFISGILRNSIQLSNPEVRGMYLRLEHVKVREMEMGMLISCEYVKPYRKVFTHP